jgi:hypothetical protein
MLRSGDRRDLGGGRRYFLGERQLAGGDLSGLPLRMSSSGAQSKALEDAT